MPAPHNSQPLITSSLGGHFFPGFDKEIFPPSLQLGCQNLSPVRILVLNQGGISMLQCVMNAKIFWFLVAITRHPCVAKRKRCRWQIPESAPLIPGCWCPAPVWKFGYPGVPKAGAGVSGRLGATAGARNPRKSQAPVGRWPLGWKHVSFENGFEDYCWEEMSNKFQLKERGSNIFKPR